MQKQFKKIFLITLFLTLVSCAKTQSTATDSSNKALTTKLEQETFKDKEFTPKLITLVKGDKTVHLFGSVHVGKPEFYPLPDYVLNKFNQSKGLAVELDLTNEETINKTVQSLASNVTFTNGEVLSNYIKPENIDKLKEYLNQDIASNIDFFRPWFVYAAMSLESYNNLGYTDELGVDLHLLELAKSKNKTITALETPAQQISALTEIPDKDMAIIIEKSIPYLDKLNDQAKDLILAWKTNNDSFFQQLIEEQENMLPKELSDRLNNSLIFSRNNKMATVIHKLNKTQSPLFVTIGALHIFGDKSIQDYMQKSGYKIKK